MCEPHGFVLVTQHESSLELYRELGFCSMPFFRGPFPLGLDVAKRQVDELGRGLIARKLPLVSDGLSYAAV